MKEVIIQLAVTLLQLFASIVLSVGALYTGMQLLDRLTAGIDEWKEIKKGNVATGIFFTAVIFSFFLLMQPRIEEFVTYVQAALPLNVTIYCLALAFINYVLALAMSVLVIYLAINLIDKLTTDISEMDALRKGNIAVALVMSVLVICVAIAARYPLESMFAVVRALESGALG